MADHDPAAGREQPTTSGGALEGGRRSDDRIAQNVPFVPPVPQKLTDELVLGTLRRLPTTFQEVILLCDVEELSYKEAAEALAIPIGTVMSRLHRGRARLRVELAAADGLLIGRSTGEEIDALKERIEAS